MKISMRCFSSVILENTVKSFDSIPGPLALPFIGSLWKYFPIIGDYDLKHPDKNAYKLLTKYGPIVKEKLNKGEIVNVFEPDDIENVCKSEGSFPSRITNLGQQFYRDKRPHLYNDGGIVAVNGKDWWRLRRAFQKYLSRIQDVRLFLPENDRIIGEFIDLVINKSLKSDDFLSLLSKLNLELIWSTLFNTRFGCFNDTNSNSAIIAKDIIETVDVCNSAIVLTDLTQSLWTNFKTPTLKNMEKCLSFIENVLEEHIIKAGHNVNANKFQNNETFSLVENYLRCPEIDLKDVRGFVADTIFAGIDTTSNTTSFLIYHLSNNKRVQMKLKEEALRLLPDANSPVTSAVLNEANYTKAVFKETFRINPTVIGNGRILAKDTILSGYMVPQGTEVFIHNMVACRLEKHFKNPNTFIPERWIRGSKDYCNASPYLVQPFGQGLRSCIARRLAEQNMLTFLLKISRNYSLEWNGSKELDIIGSFLCKPNIPIEVSFKSY